MTAYENAIEKAAMAAVAGVRSWEFIEEALALRGGITDDGMVSRRLTLEVLSDVADHVGLLLREELLPELQRAVPELSDQVQAAIDDIAHDFAAGIEERFAPRN